jgi:hypothetical protein
MKEMKFCLWIAALMAVGVWLAPVSALGQSQTAPAKTQAAGKWMPARTSDGQPDIQGMWNGGAGFEDASFPRPEVNSAPPGVDCTEKYRFSKATGIANTECAAYVALFTGVVNGKPGFGTGNSEAAPRDRYASLVDLPDHKLPWSAEGVVKRADIVDHLFNPPDLQHVDPITRCMPTWRPGGQQFLQIPGYVVILFEENHVTRVIPVDGRPHLSSRIRLPQGDPVGRWEGNTLVVETTNFNGGGWYNNTGSTIQSVALRVTERFTVVDPNTMNYLVTIDDPKFFTKPWSFRGSFRREKPANEQGMQTNELLEYACTEGSPALKNILERPDRPVPPEVFVPR